MPKSPDAKPAKAPRARATAKPAKTMVEAGAKPSSAAAKPAKPASKPSAKPAVKAGAKVGAKVGDKAQALATGVKLRDLVDSVAAATGVKKSDAKVSVEATLAALAAALKAGADMTLPPLGKLRVVKLAEKGGVTMMTLKLRHGGGQKPGAKPLADDGEDS